MQATCENIGINEVGAPDAPAGLDVCGKPASVIAVTQEPRAYCMPCRVCSGCILESGRGVRLSNCQEERHE